MGAATVQAILDTIVSRMDANEAIFKKILDDLDVPFGRWPSERPKDDPSQSDSLSRSTRP